MANERGPMACASLLTSISFLLTSFSKSLEGLIKQWNRQPHHIEITPGNMGHEFRGQSLDGIGAGFIQRLAAQHIGVDFIFAELAEGSESVFVFERLDLLRR